MPGSTVYAAYTKPRLTRRFAAFLFPAPIGRRQLLVYNVVSRLRIQALSALWMAAFALRYVDSWLAGYMGCFLILAFPSCDMKDRKGSSEALKEEIKERELKRVTEVEIFEAATKVGEQIAIASQKTLATNLKTAISQQGVEYAIKFCKLQAMPLTDSLSKKFAAQIRRTSLKIRNPANRPNDLESQILDAY